MPIKFRCQHCRQFLGISRAQAGGIVDCPTCGRTIRVPELDGTLRALPKPGLDPQDSKLAAALDELASIGDVDGFEDSPANAGRETAVPDSDVDRKRLSPHLRKFVVLGPDGQPVDLDALPERADFRKDGDSQAGKNVGTLNEVPAQAPPVELPPPALDPPEPVSPPQGGPALPDDDSMKQDRPWAETAQPGDSWKKLLAAASNQSDEDSADSENKKQDGASPGSKLAPAGSRAARGGLSGGMWFALIGAAAILFAGGFWVGRVTTVTGDSDSSNSPTSGGADGTATGSDGDTKPDTPTPGAKPALRGRITFLSEGQRKPDRGARVIVLPKDRSGSVKLPVAGFRSGDSPEDQRIAEAALTAMGGAMTSASDEGEFEISLPSSGQFYVLVLSNSVMREAGTPDADVEAAIAQYFDRPSALLGRVRCYVEEVRWSGDEAEPWDHSFRG